MKIMLISSKLMYVIIAGTGPDRKKKNTLTCWSGDSDLIAIHEYMFLREFHNTLTLFTAVTETDFWNWRLGELVTSSCNVHVLDVRDSSDECLFKRHTPDWIQFRWKIVGWWSKHMWKEIIILNPDVPKTEVKEEITTSPGKKLEWW